MANDELVAQVMAEVSKQMQAASTPVQSAACNPSGASNQSPQEFVGVNPLGNTIGLVIANADSQLLEQLQLKTPYRSLGIVGARTGAGPHIFAADEATKMTNASIVKIELPRDTEGGAGHGSLIIFGAHDVSDAQRAVHITLQELNRTFGDVYGNNAGHLEFQYTARAGEALHAAFGAEIGKAFGITVGAPAAIGVVLADTAVKGGTVDMVGYSSPASGTSFSNEVISCITGDSGAVRQAIQTAREVGKVLLGALDTPPASSTTPYI